MMESYTTAERGWTADSYAEEIVIRYAETDAMGVVHHASYPVWFEHVRVAMLRVRGLPYEEIERSGRHVPVIELEVKYLQSLKFGDPVRVETTCEREGAVRFSFRYRVLSGETLIATGRTGHVFIDGSGRPVRQPAEFVKAFDGF